MVASTRTASKTTGKIDPAKKPMKSYIKKLLTPMRVKTAEAVAISDASEWKSIHAAKYSCPPVPVRLQRHTVKVFKGKRYPK
jgi:hypothetical protein